MLKWCGLSIYTEIVAFPTQTNTHFNQHVIVTNVVNIANRGKENLHAEFPCISHAKEFFSYVHFLDSHKCTNKSLNSGHFSVKIFPQ